jgi:hypothetical protein
MLATRQRFNHTHLFTNPAFRRAMGIDYRTQKNLSRGRAKKAGKKRFFFGERCFEGKEGARTSPGTVLGRRDGGCLRLLLRCAGVVSRAGRKRRGKAGFLGKGGLRGREGARSSPVAGLGRRGGGCL